MFKKLMGLIAGAVLVAGATAAHAQPTKVAIGFIPVSDWLPAFVAKEKGIFCDRSFMHFLRVPDALTPPPSRPSGCRRVRRADGMPATARPPAPPG